MEDTSIMAKVLDHLIQKYPAPLPPGAPPDIEPATMVQFTLKAGFTAQGAVRKSNDFYGIYIAVCATRDQRGQVNGAMEVYFHGSELVFVARPIEQEQSRIVPVGAGLPSGVKMG